LFDRFGSANIECVFDSNKFLLKVFFQTLK